MAGALRMLKVFVCPVFVATAIGATHLANGADNPEVPPVSAGTIKKVALIADAALDKDRKSVV